MFTLEKYHTPASRHTCPKCGRRRCFTLYVDSETQKPIDPSCGKCDHLNSCGYHLPPREYYRLHPSSERLYKEYVPYRTYRAERAERAYKTYKPHETYESFKTYKPHETHTPDDAPHPALSQALAQAGSWRDTTLWPWLLHQFPGRQADVERTCTAYRLGAWPDHRAIYWQIDQEGHVRDGKLMDYLPDGHRTGNPSWVSAELRRLGRLPADAATRKCLFGLHLLTARPDACICLVESEKTALWCAIGYPQHLWLATGGCQALNVQAIQPLKGRKVVVWPDSGCYEKWTQVFQQSGHTLYTIHNLDCLPGNWDIVDLMKVNL